jgi:hypothetical protein
MPIGNGGIIGPANVPTLASAKGVWSLREAQLAQRQGIWPLGLIPDPYFEYTTLLLPGNGTNGATNNTFLDGSTNNFTITRNGNTTQGTFSPFSQTGWGNYFSGSGQYLSVADSADFDVAAGNFTIEAFVFRGTTGVRTFIFGQGDGVSDTNTSVTCEVTAANKLASYYGVGSTATAVTATNDFPSNAWVHVAIVRNGGTLTQYINGTKDGENTSFGSQTINNSSTIFGIGSLGTLNSLRWNGYISNLRFVKGTAVYTANFTPSTTPLTAISGTSLLTCQSNRFIDTNTQTTAKTITVNGSPSVQAFSPFNPTSSWSATTNGGSGYFDGNGDYLSVAYNSALNLGTGDFTVEFWFYNTTTVGSPYDLYLALCGPSGLAIYRNSSNKLSIDQNAVGILMTSTNNVPQGQWTHIAVTRSGTALKAFMNGVQEASVTNSTNFSGTSTTTIFSQGASAYCTGYGSDFRIVKGTAVYTAAFTPPTAPLTAITNTSLLLNFTNAGIYDATSKNDLETVGNAQISTTQSKWGGSSMAFDGTGDYLLSPDQPIQRIGTGNFTIECWVYRNSSGTYGLVGKGTGTTGWLLSLNSSNQVVFTYGSSTITSTGTVSATTWTYIAVVREGTGTNQTKIYINGSNDGTGTVSTDFNQTNSLYVGADRTGGSNANVYLQDLRISNYARTITASPTAAFPTL